MSQNLIPELVQTVKPVLAVSPFDVHRAGGLGVNCLLVFFPISLGQLERVLPEAGLDDLVSDGRFFLATSEIGPNRES